MNVTVIERTEARPSLAADHPLRICLVTEAAGGGVGRHFLDLAAGLAARGHRVVGIYSPGRCDAWFAARRADSGMARCIGLPMRRALHPLDATDLWQLVRLIRRLGPFDLIHGHSSKGGALSRLAARWRNIPAVYTPHAFVTLDPTLPPWRRALYGQIELCLTRCTAAIVAVSDDEAVHARGLGIETRKIHVVPNGIDLPDFPLRDSVRSQLGLSPDDFVIGFVGRMVPQKAPDVLLNAFAAVLKQHATARLVMIGSGPLEAETRRQAERLGLSRRIRLLGDVVATAIMPAFDVFCLSSRFEGMPYVLLEALAAGLPIVSTHVGGVTMCVEPGINGLIVPPGDVSALASGLLQLASDPQLRRRLAAASASISARFTVQQMVEQTLDVYAQILARR